MALIGCLTIGSMPEREQHFLYFGHKKAFKTIDHSHGDNSLFSENLEIADFLAGQFPMLFCLVHAVLIMVTYDLSETLKTQALLKIPSSEFRVIVFCNIYKNDHWEVF